MVESLLYKVERRPYNGLLAIRCWSSKAFAWRGAGRARNNSPAMSATDCARFAAIRLKPAVTLHQAREAMAAVSPQRRQHCRARRVDMLRRNTQSNPFESHWSNQWLTQNPVMARFQSLKSNIRNAPMRPPDPARP